MDSQNQITKTTQSSSPAAQIQETTMMLMQPNANWEEYLTPAPLSIAIMGELVFISSNKDFSINTDPPKDDFKYIQYPDSFKACLMQVTNLAWHAFSEAHNNMDRIRIHTSTVPDYMKAVLKILFGGSDEIIEHLLPNQLENIRTIADECVKLASNAEKKYSDVINLIHELLETCANAEHLYVKGLEEVRKNLENNKLREKKAQEQKELLKKHMDNLSKSVDKAQHEYSEAMNSMPSGFDMIGMDVVEGLTSIFTGGSKGGSASQKATENAKFRIEKSQEQLKEAQEGYRNAMEKMERDEKALTEILIEMQNCKIKEIDFDTTIKMLVKGLDAMGRVKEQWEKMVRFFQMVSNIVHASLSKILHDFVKTSDVTRKLSYDDKLFTKDLLFKQAIQASSIASLVHMISGTYTEVSNKYLMDRVSSLGRLMAMDKDKPEFMQERLNLQQSCKAAQEGILQLALKNKEEFERKADAKILEIESGLKAILPAVAP